jgi:hypothetical protein
MQIGYAWSRQCNLTHAPPSPCPISSLAHTVEVDGEHAFASSGGPIIATCLEKRIGNVVGKLKWPLRINVNSYFGIAFRRFSRALVAASNSRCARRVLPVILSRSRRKASHVESGVVANSNDK